MPVAKPQVGGVRFLNPAYRPTRHHNRHQQDCSRAGRQVGPAVLSRYSAPYFVDRSRCEGLDVGVRERALSRRRSIERVDREGCASTEPERRTNARRGDGGQPREPVSGHSESIVAPAPHLDQKKEAVT